MPRTLEKPAELDLDEFEGALNRYEMRSALDKLSHSVYDDELHPKLAFRVCSRMGATIPDLAMIFGVKERVISVWKNKHPRFSKALKAGRDIYDTEVVESALRTRAVGYSKTIEKSIAKTKVVTDKSGMPVLDDHGEVLTYTERIETEEEMYFPPDTRAIIFFLCNRNGMRWRRNAEKLEMNTHKHVHLDMSKFSTEELQALKDMSAKANGKLDQISFEKASFTEADMIEMQEVAPDIVEEMVDNAQN